MEYKASTNNNAVTVHSHMKRNIPGGLLLTITLLFSAYAINTLNSTELIVDIKYMERRGK